MPIRAPIIGAVLLAAGIPAGLAYAEQNHIPPEVVRWALPAILLELLLYLSLAFENLRSRWTPRALVLAAPAPLLLAHAGARWREALLVALLAAVAAYWFRALPRARVTDFGFLAVAGAPVLLRWFKTLYPDPSPDLDLAFMGQLMWIRTTAASVLNDRKPDGVCFGLWPQAREWKTGLIWFAALLAPVFALNAMVGFSRVGLPGRPMEQVLLLAIGTFFGILWVVALSEELIFRGLLQSWLREATRSRAAAVAVTSVLFGAVHLGFRAFPNWKFALLAAVAGVGYGMAFEQGRGIRAAMVSHAALVTVWRLFFR